MGLSGGGGWPRIWFEFNKENSQDKDDGNKGFNTEFKCTRVYDKVGRDSLETRCQGIRGRVLNIFT